MKILDRYILVNFLISYLIMAFVLIGLYVVVDLTLNSDEFTEHQQSALATLGDIGSYYGHQVFVYFQQLAGIITLVSAIVTLTTMNRRNEMTAILSSGVSLYRVIWPVLALGLAFNALALLDQEVIVPRFADKLVRSHDSVSAEAAAEKQFGVWDYPLTDAASDDDRCVVAEVAQPGGATLAAGATQAVFHLRDDDETSLKAARLLRPGDALAVYAGDSDQVRLYVRVPEGEAGQAGFVRMIPVTTEGVAQDGYRNLPAAVGSSLDQVAPGDRVRPVEPPIYRLSAVHFNSNPRRYEMLDVDITKRHPRTLTPLARIRADYAVWDPASGQWDLAPTARMAFLAALPAETEPRRARIKDFPVAPIRCSVTPRQIILRHSSHYWMQFMSTMDLKRLSENRNAGAADQARSIMLVRFTQPAINMILLMLGVPFVLTRAPVSLWAGILKCVLISGSCFVLSFVCQQISGDTANWAVIAAWLPVFLFGPLAVLMLDSVKT